MSDDDEKTAMQPDMFDANYKAGEWRKVKQAATQAVATADRETDPAWSDEAQRLIAIYAEDVFPAPFTTSEARQFAYEQGLPQHFEDRAWGGIIRSVASLGYVVYVG